MFSNPLRNLELEIRSHVSEFRTIRRSTRPNKRKQRPRRFERECEDAVRSRRSGARHCEVARHGLCLAVRAARPSLEVGVSFLSDRDRIRTRTFIVFALLILPLAASAQTTRLVAIGDSITQAATNRGADGGYSYRYWLWRNLLDAGADIDFVGSHDVTFGGSGDPDLPPYLGQAFDRDHEGHFSQSTLYISENLPFWLTGYDADAALIHIGHNDGWQGILIEDTRTNLVDIVATLQQDNASITVLLAKVIPSNPDQEPEGSSFPLAHINAVNALIDAVAAQTTTATSAVHAVDLNDGFNPLTMIYDGVHPNALGEQFMADRFYEALETHVLPEPAPRIALAVGATALFSLRRFRHQRLSPFKKGT